MCGSNDRSIGCSIASCSIDRSFDRLLFFFLSCCFYFSYVVAIIFARYSSRFKTICLDQETRSRWELASRNIFHVASFTFFPKKKKFAFLLDLNFRMLCFLLSDFLFLSSLFSKPGQKFIKRGEKKECKK